MSKLVPLPRSFFARPTLMVARQILGKQLVKVEKGQRLVGVITEVEAYVGEGDLACHAKAGRTNRTAIMYGPAGHLYVYFTYGMHWMLNIITEGEDCPAAILLRGVHLTEGLGVAIERRGRTDQLTNGPAKLAQALAIDKTWNGIDLCAPRSALFVADGVTVPARKIKATPRVGIGSTPEPWLSLPWNFSYIPN